MGATNTLARVAASVGAVDGVPLAFEKALDVPHGGVLFALPALLTSGLLEHTRKHFALPKGYYPLASLFLLLAFLALCRVRSLEQLRYQAPGEWGKLLGLDRVPEVRTLREKVHQLAQDDRPEKWSTELCQQWMAASPGAAHVLYVDGHVRVYHGEQTKLPRHHVAREKLCLRATVDYWVNAMDGQPFFLVSQAVDPGLIQVLEDEIVPRLLEEVPGQPTAEQLAADPLLHRFTVVFDREGYSPGLLARLKEQRIACLTYHKHPGEDWPDEEFQVRSVRLASGEVVEMALAERGTYLGNLVWVREVRKRLPGGGQTAILSTDYRDDLDRVAAAMFARWSQENFFRYMREHYGLDRLVDYGTEEIPETVQTVNPAWRTLDGEVRKHVGILTRKQAAFGERSLQGEIAPEKVESFERKQAALQEVIEVLHVIVERLKAARKATAHHVPVAQLPAADRFRQLSTPSKHFIDTIKMIAYRAETAMAGVVWEQMSRADDARSLLRCLYATEADLLPDEAHGTLTVRLHHLATHCSDATLLHLCTELNATETCFPGTKLRLVYEPVSLQNPRDQEV